MTTSVDGIAAKIEKLSAERKQSKKDLKRLTEQLASYEKAFMIESAVDCNGVNLIVQHFPDGDDEYLRMLSAGLKSEPNTVAVLGAGNGAVICSASNGVDVDFTRSAVAMASAVGGSGGGQATFVQLRLPGDVNVVEFLKKVGDNVKTSL